MLVCVLCSYLRTLYTNVLGQMRPEGNYHIKIVLQGNQH